MLLMTFSIEGIVIRAETPGGLVHVLARAGGERHLLHELADTNPGRDQFTPQSRAPSTLPAR